MKNFITKKIVFSVLVVSVVLGMFLFFGLRLLNTEKSLIVENIEQVDSEEKIKTAEEKPKENEAGEQKDDGEEKTVKVESTKETTDESEEEKKVEEENSSPSFEIEKHLVSWGFSVPKESREIDTIIIHSSYDALHDNPYDPENLIDEYKIYGVSPHFLIDRKGNVYQLVENKNIAYHAGESQVPDGRTSVNNFSIGIEIMNTKTDDYKEDQYESLNNLLNHLKEKYEIKYILGHDEIAPERKSDPWNFDWKKIGIEK